jgi:glyoxylase I family protein
MTNSTNPSPAFAILGLDHVVLRVSDMKSSIIFYCDILGCTLERSVDNLGLVQLRAGASLIDLIDVAGTLGQQGGPAPSNTAHNVDHFCIRIEPFDIISLRTLFDANGLSFEEPGRRYGADGFGPSIYVRDPSGNSLELKGPPEATRD